MLNVSIQYYHSVYVMGQNNCCSLRLLLPSMSANRISAQSQVIYQIHTGLETSWQLLGNHRLLGEEMQIRWHQATTSYLANESVNFSRLAGSRCLCDRGFRWARFLTYLIVIIYYGFHFHSLNERKQGKKKTTTKNQLHHTPRGKKTVQTKRIRFIYLCVLPVPFLFWFLIIKWRVLNDLWVHFA